MAQDSKIPHSKIPHKCLPWFLTAVFIAALLVFPHGDAQAGSDVNSLMKGLTNQNGKPVSGKDFQGKYKLVYFGFTSCTDECPMTVLFMSQILDQLKGDAGKLAEIFVTVDPDTDTPKKLKVFLEHFSPAITGLTGTQRQVDAVEAAYQTWSPKADGQAQPIGDSSDHSGYIYFMDPQGRCRAVFTINYSPQEIAGKIKAYMAEK